MADRDTQRRCQRCSRPAARCLCVSIPRIVSATRLVIIQHPSERRHALNTARLLAAGLVSAELHVVEEIKPDSMLYAQITDVSRRTELLFPGKHALPLNTVSARCSRQLILLDGTWRKARKLLHINPILQSLPQVSLPPGLVSRYRLRKAPGPGALATIEAGVAALTMLEPNVDFQPLLQPFDRLIEEQIAAMGAERYQCNYAGRLAAADDEQTRR